MPLQIKQRYINPLKNTMMLIAGLGDYVQRRQAEVGVRITQRTADKYERLLRYLKQYLAQRGPEEDIPVERMNYEFLDGFSLFLQTAHRCRHNGAVVVMDCLRNFVLYCPAQRMDCQESLPLLQAPQGGSGAGQRAPHGPRKWKS